MTREQAERELAEYQHAVDELVALVRGEVEEDDVDYEQALDRELNDAIETHPYVINLEKRLLTLQYSDYACAAFYDGNLPQPHRKDEFPFGAFAASALYADCWAILKPARSERVNDHATATGMYDD